MSAPNWQKQSVHLPINQSNVPKNRSKLMKSWILRGNEVSVHKNHKNTFIQTHISTSILINSHHPAVKNYFVHCDCVYFLFTMFCSSLTVSSPGERCGSQFLFSHPPSHPSTPIHRTLRHAKIYGCRHGDRHGDRRGGRHGGAHGGQHGGWHGGRHVGEHHGRHGPNFLEF